MLKSIVEGKEVQYNDIIDPFFAGLVDRVRAHTITLCRGVEAPWALYQAIEYIVKNKIPGDIVECGVWNGGSILLAALALQHFGDTSRKLYLYDTFEGMPKPSDLDRRYDGIPALPVWEAAKQKGQSWGFGGTLEMVQEVVYSSGYPRDKLVFVKGMVEDTIPAIKPDVISLLRLDTDFYQSTRHELIHLYPSLVSRGILIIDDYGFFQGARQAVDEYIAAHNPGWYLSRVDEGVRLVVKP